MVYKSSLAENFRGSLDLLTILLCLLCRHTQQESEVILAYTIFLVSSLMKYGEKYLIITLINLTAKKNKKKKT